MNTEIRDYIRELSKKEFFWANFINMILGAAVILLGIIGIIEELTFVAYASMFLSGFIMMLLNFYKARKTGNKNVWMFLAGAIVFGAMSVWFLISL